MGLNFPFQSLLGDGKVSMAWGGNEMGFGGPSTPNHSGISDPAPGGEGSPSLVPGGGDSSLLLSFRAQLPVQCILGFWNELAGAE